MLGARWRELLERAVARVMIRPRALLWTAIAAYAAGFSALSILRHRAFSTGRFDLGNMAQAVWSTAHGHPLQITGLRGDQVSRLGAHFDPILAAFAPLWLDLAEPGPAARRAGGRGRARRAARLLARAQAPRLRAGRRSASRSPTSLYPPTQWLTLNEFHPVALACPLLLFAIWFLDEDRLRAVRALRRARRDDEGGDRARRRRARPLVRARARPPADRSARSPPPVLAVALIAIEVVIPHFNRAGTSSFFTALQRRSAARPAGSCTPRSPTRGKIVTTAFTGRGLGYLARLVLPLGGLVVLAPLVLRRRAAGARA